jgi:4-diphosphocytidyl-2-C-methyl-D-erythritol kinase
MLRLKAPAKINLTLEALKLRDDGYHEIATVLQTVDLCDVITFEEADTLKFECDESTLSGRDNLVWQAATLLREEHGVKHGANIHLQKIIPQAAGLGGGSSDAAAVLKGLNTLWGLGLSLDRLSEMGAILGSDVPFFIRGGTALARSRGEQIELLAPAQIPWVMILYPEIQVPANKTKFLYESLNQSQFTRGFLTLKLAERIRGHGDIPIELLFNVFDSIAMRTYPDLGVYWNSFQELGAQEVHLCGSGPAMFTLFKRHDLALALRTRLDQSHDWSSYLVTPFQPENQT